MSAMLLLRRRSVLDLLTPTAADSNTSDKHAEHEDDNGPRRPATATASLAPPPALSSGRPNSENAMPMSRLSHEVLRSEVPDSPPIQEENSRTKRFSMLRFRNYSESHLSVRAKEDAKAAKERERENAPPVPAIAPSVATPTIVKTAPTFAESEQIPERRPRRTPFIRTMSKVKSREEDLPRQSADSPRSREKKDKGGSSLRWRRMQGRSTGLEDLMRLSAANAKHNQDAPPAYGNEDESELALPVPRFSESSRSDGSHGSSQGDHIYGSTTTTTHTVSTHTTFFKLPRRNKNRNSLFPLPHRLAPPENPESPGEIDLTTPRASTSGLSLRSLNHSPERLRSPPQTALQRRHTDAYSPPRHQQHSQLGQFASPHAALAQSSLSFAEPGMNLGRNPSQHSHTSSMSSPLQPPMRLGARERASTTSSWGRGSMDTPPPLTASTRNSTSTTGRSSLGGFLNLARFRQNSEPHSPKHGSPGTRSKSNSFAMSREALVVPEREEGDTPGKYLERLESAVSRSMIAGILSKSSDPFAQAVLRSYTRRFPFFGEPIDMSLRKYLLEAELPKETQQVDRVIQSFADRYHECNPGIFLSPDQAYVVAFSLMMLHTDAFNKNNKRKMTKQDYVKNTSGQHVDAEILGCFYDNICYTPFVHYDEEVDINGERVLPLHFKSKKSKLKGAITDSNGKKPSGPVDPYNLLVDQKLDMLRPPIKDEIMMDDPYNYLPSQRPLDIEYLQRAFTHTGTLQIISARSRPAAYEGQVNNTQPHLPIETQQGIVDLKITKVGTLWRKSAKRKKTRSPWQEWGAILTGSQLYLFKNAHWAKGLVHQFMSHQRHGAPRTPVIFKPPLQDFKPDALIKTDNAVALVDATYQRHKNAFTFVRPGGHEEVLLADNEVELNDWLGLINYAAACRAASVRIRGMVGGSEEESRIRDVQRLDSTHSMHSVQTATGEVTVKNRGLTPTLARQVMAARRQIMVQKIQESEKELSEMAAQLDDMLRNARHLLILAPITPKTREEVLHAASRADAMLKWLRRDIWRTKCHKEILALDVQQDGVSASELLSMKEKEEKKAEKALPDTPNTAKKEPQRLISQGSAKSTASPKSLPQSPRSSQQQSPRSPNSARPTIIARPSTAESMTNFVDDVFRTHQDVTASPTPKSADGWRLPPLQLDVDGSQSQLPANKHRGSIASTLLTAESHTSQRQQSWSASSATSSQHQRLNSPHPSEKPPALTPTPSIPDQDLERLAQVTPEPAPQRTMNLDGMSSATPPNRDRDSSTRHKSARRSLQKTLRDAHHHSSHRHRRNKESESTVRSADGTADADANIETPGLDRGKGRFILHGKQASVIQFGDDWPNERMRARREKWKSSSSSRSPHDGRRPSLSGRRATSEKQDWAVPGSPVVQALAHDGTDGATDTDDDTYSRSASTVDSELLPDAEAAREFADRGRLGIEEVGEARVGGYDPYDLRSVSPGKGKGRVDVPSSPSPAGHTSTVAVLPGQVILAETTNFSDDEDEDEDNMAKPNRRTVIGPSPVHIPQPATTGTIDDTTGATFASHEASRAQKNDDWFGLDAATTPTLDRETGKDLHQVPLSDDELLRLIGREGEVASSQA